MERIISVLKEAKGVLILPHVNADGDALGSSIALSKFIRNMGVKAVIYVEDKIPSNLEFFGEEYETYHEGDDVIDYDVAVAVDCGDTSRLSERISLFQNAKIKINIDHHVTNDSYADINYVDSEAAATGEIIFDIIKRSGIPLEKDIAAVLYTAILTDTGGFRFSNTKAKTHAIAAELIGIGIDSAKICETVYDTKKLSQLKIEAETVKALEIYHGGKTALSVITRDMMEQTGAEDDQTDALSGILRGISGVCVGVTLKEKGDNKIRVSMRSKGNVNVANICGALGGGGHAKAAGATMQDDIQKCKEQIIRLIGEEYERCL